MAERALRRGQPQSGLVREIIRNRWAYIFISPFFILFAIFQAFPVAYSVYLSLYDWSGIGPMTYVKFKNYDFLLGPGGKAFQQSLQNGVILFFMYVPVMTLLAIVLAVLLNSKRVRGFRIYRTILFMPYITSMIAAGITFQLLLQQDNGLFNVVLQALGGSPQPWLETKWLARLSLCLLIVWGWLGCRRSRTS
jgi:cellobiose transport system permease protein